MTAAALSEAAIWAWWCNQSAAQGLVPEIEPALIQRVAELALAGNDDAPGTRPGRRDHPAAAKTKRGRSRATP